MCAFSDFISIGEQSLLLWYLTYKSDSQQSTSQIIFILF